MTATRGIDAYRRTEVESRTPLELVVMLYDGAIRFATQARDAVVRRDIPARRVATSRALAIVSQLQVTLDMDRGGPIASSLDGLYVFISEALTNGALRNEPAKIDNAIRVLQTLREAWAGIAASAEGRTGVAAPR